MSTNPPKFSHRRILWKWLLFLVVISFIGNRWWNAHQEKLALEATKKREHALYIKALTSMVDRYSTNDTWQDEIAYNSDGSARLSPIMTAEVRKLWLNGPIMATGDILDINNGMLILDMFLYDQVINISPLWTPIEFHLTINQEQENKLLELCRSSRDSLFGTSINAIASITNVDTKMVASEDGHERCIVGLGDCLDFLPVKSPWD